MRKNYAIILTNRKVLYSLHENVISLCPLDVASHLYVFTSWWILLVFKVNVINSFPVVNIYTTVEASCPIALACVVKTGLNQFLRTLDQLLGPVSETSEALIESWTSKECVHWKVLVVMGLQKNMLNTKVVHLSFLTWAAASANDENVFPRFGVLIKMLSDDPKHVVPNTFLFEEASSTCFSPMLSDVKHVVPNILVLLAPVESIFDDRKCSVILQNIYGQISSQSNRNSLHNFWLFEPIEIKICIVQWKCI